MFSRPLLNKFFELKTFMKKPADAALGGCKLSKDKHYGFAYNRMRVPPVVDFLI